MKKYRPTRWTQNWFLSPEIIFQTTSDPSLGLPGQVKRGVGEWADGNMTWTFHGASPVVSPKFESFKISTASRPRLSRSRNVANISFSTEPLRKRCLRHPLWWLVIISLFDQRWCPLISHEMPMKTMKTQFYASRLFHEPRKHCLRNWNSHQLPTTISHLLVSNKCHKNSPIHEISICCNQKCYPWVKKTEHMRQLRLMRQVNFCHPWAKWAARDQWWTSKSST